MMMPFGISSMHSNSMLSGNPHSGIYEAETARTLDLNGGNPACNQGGIVVIEVVGTLLARDYKGADTFWAETGKIVIQKEKEQEYAARRFTPTECARLQGFPDWWAEPGRKEEMTDADAEFWQRVRDTDCRLRGLKPKKQTPEQLLAWYNKLHSDAAEYKMCGNGVALPCVLYIMEGIADIYEEASA